MLNGGRGLPARESIVASRWRFKLVELTTPAPQSGKQGCLNTPDAMLTSRVAVVWRD
jgi:hypothetical protein